MVERTTRTDEAGIPAAADRALVRWRRRVRLGLFVGGFVDGLGAVALVGAGALLVLRLFGIVPAPRPLWAAALVVPVVVAWMRVRRSSPTRTECALHLDRRLGLEGLLLTGIEQDASSWGERLESGVAGAADVLPRIRLGRLLPRALLPLLALLAVVLFPPPTADARRSEPALAQALERFERRFEELARHQALKEETRDEVRERIDALKERQEKGESASWSDLDSMSERIDREAARRGAELAKAQASIGEFTKREGGSSDEAREDLAARLERSRPSGLLEGLPESLAARAGLEESGSAGDAVDPSALPQDAQALRDLAEALAKTAGERLEGLAKLGAIDPADLRALEEMLDADQLAELLEGEPCPECHGEKSGSCKHCRGTGRMASRDGRTGRDGKPGRGGVDRGRGDAALDLSGSTEAGTEAARPERLPPGSPLPSPSMRIGLGRASPETRPEKDGGAGSAAGEGFGAASWQRRIAPRHRDAVRAYFGGEGKPETSSSKDAAGK